MVQGYGTVDVRLSGGETYEGEVLGVDEVADLALLDIRAFRDFDPVTLGDSDSIAVGEDVIAMGFPLGSVTIMLDSPTITRGIVSAKRVSDSGIKLLQTDAAINPGSSGGPLIDREGRVVGINTSKAFKSGDGRPVEGIGLAVAINEVRDRLDILAGGGVAPASDGAPVRVQDRAALVALYNATDGANWRRNDNWLSEAPLGQWYGVTTDSSGYVVELDLSFNELHGEILPDLGNLTMLTSLRLGGNRLTGTIPVRLGQLSSLRTLSLSFNQLAGMIPPALGDLGDLRFLILYDNQLTGRIPPALGDLRDLRSLNLGSNQLSGEIPQALGKLTKLTYLSLESNQLTGRVPPELGNLVELDELYLYSNELNGKIPPELGKLHKLRLLYLSDNQLVGPIPPELENLTSLWNLSLDENQLSGEIPPELGNLGNLRALFLEDNRFIGMIPPELGNLTDLRRLNLQDNRLTGDIPPELNGLSRLEELLLGGGNQWTACIPEGLMDVAENDLDTLDLSFCGADTHAETRRTGRRAAGPRVEEHRLVDQLRTVHPGKPARRGRPDRLLVLRLHRLHPHVALPQVVAREVRRLRPGDSGRSLARVRV